MTVLFCFKCGEKYESPLSSCSSCGQDLTILNKLLKRPTLTPKVVATLVGAAVALSAALWFSNSHFLGAKPTVHYSAGSSDTGSTSGEKSLAGLQEDPQTHALKMFAKTNPDDLEAHRALVAALIDKYRATPAPSQDLTLDLLEALSAIIRIDPKDTTALLMIADLSFDRQVFDKAVQFYEQYLQLNSTDLAARSRFASALTFQGQFDRAISELELVLASEPNNFAALAYLSITLSQQGNKEKSLEIGETALKSAPNEEARARFSMFLASVKENRAGTSSKSNDHPVLVHIRANPIAGPKVAGSELNQDESVLKVALKDFPMQAMPEAVREKFLAGVRANIALPLKKVILVDHAGATMATIEP